MTRELATLPPTASVAEAAGLMARRRIRHLPITADGAAGSRLLGLVSAHDLFLASDPDVHPFSPRAKEHADRRQVGDLMCREVCTIPPAVPIEEAARILRDRKIGSLPVVDAGRLVGILTEHDVLRAFMELCGSDRTTCRITVDLRAADDPVASMAELGRRHGLRLLSMFSLDHDGRRLGMMTLSGRVSQDFVDAVWSSGHAVLRVQAGAAAKEPAVGRNPG